MLAHINSLGLRGIEGFTVEIDVDFSPGMPQFDIVGLPDGAVKEARERVRAAIRNSGFDFKPSRYTVNLAPAGVRKEGAVYDLPIAVGVLCAVGEIEAIQQDAVFLGELGLDGALRPVRGVLPMLLHARGAGFRSAIVPKANAAEGAYVEGLRVYGVENLRELVDIFARKTRATPETPAPYDPQSAWQDSSHDFMYIKGQHGARRAMEVAASGGHNLLMLGPPGSGKSMLAHALPTILPPLRFEEAIEVTQVLSVAGSLPQGTLTAQRPFRSPHHTASPAAISGGGTPIKPGDISLAHRGVLFLDELPEFNRQALEAMRQPLEDGYVTISRAGMSLRFPSEFMLVGAMNPCPCGYWGSKTRECRCTPVNIRRYLDRISGPLLDRIDIHVEVGEIDYEKLTEKSRGESSHTIRERVLKTRERQYLRYHAHGIRTNAQLSGDLLERFCALDAQGDAILRRAYEKHDMSARGRVRTLRLARTLADMEGAEAVGAGHVAEAVQYRGMDQKYW